MNGSDERAKDFISKILGSKEGSYDYLTVDGLPIDPAGNLPDQIDKAWLNMTRVVYEAQKQEIPDAEKAFSKLLEVTKKLPITPSVIAAAVENKVIKYNPSAIAAVQAGNEVVKYHRRQEDEKTEDSDEDSDNGDAMEQDRLIEPPLDIKNIYSQATAAILDLKEHRINEENVEFFDKLNSDIENIRLQMPEEVRAEVTKDYWKIRYGDFNFNYQLIRDDPKVYPKISILINTLVDRYYYPTSWKVDESGSLSKRVSGSQSAQSGNSADSHRDTSESAGNNEEANNSDDGSHRAADDYRNAQSGNTGSEGSDRDAGNNDEANGNSRDDGSHRDVDEFRNAGSGNHSLNDSLANGNQGGGGGNNNLANGSQSGGGGGQDPPRFNYPWFTMRTRNKKQHQYIIAYRKRGIGHQVVTETLEEGRWILEIKAASKISSLDFAEYISKGGRLLSKENRKAWNPDNAKQLKVVKVSRNRIKRKNTAAANRNPDCIVVVRISKDVDEDVDEDFDIWEVTLLRKRLDEVDANREIEERCEEDDILPPWDSTPISTYYDLDEVLERRSRPQGENARNVPAHSRRRPIAQDRILQSLEREPPSPNQRNLTPLPETVAVSRERLQPSPNLTPFPVPATVAVSGERSERNTTPFPAETLASQRGRSEDAVSDYYSQSPEVERQKMVEELQTKITESLSAKIDERLSAITKNIAATVQESLLANLIPLITSMIQSQAGAQLSEGHRQGLVTA